MPPNDDIKVRNCFCDFNVSRVARVADCYYCLHTLVCNDQFGDMLMLMMAIILTFAFSLATSFCNDSISSIKIT